MNQELKRNKQIIRNFMREHYTDERLAMLLAHAQSGRLSILSCCCFLGIPTANHALQGATDWEDTHYEEAVMRFGRKAEMAFNDLYVGASPEDLKWNIGEVRNRRLIPIIKAEIRRRDRERQPTASCVASAFSKDTVLSSIPT